MASALGRSRVGSPSARSWGIGRFRECPGPQTLERLESGPRWLADALWRRDPHTRISAFADMSSPQGVLLSSRGLAAAAEPHGAARSSAEPRGAARSHAELGGAA